MARRRMIDPNFWESEDVSRLSYFARLLLMGMISVADDEGRGRSSAHYLKSKLFPYDNFKTTKISDALTEIEKSISITFYCILGNYYYMFDNWTKWQRVDHPTPSIIPLPEPFLDTSRNVPETFPNESAKVSPNIINISKDNISKDNARARKPTPLFKPPSLEDVEAYCKERKNDVDSKKFFDYFTASNWIDSEGKPVLSWKQKVITWEGRKQNPKNLKAAGDYNQRTYAADHYDKDREESDKILEEYYEETP